MDKHLDCPLFKYGHTCVCPLRGQVWPRVVIHAGQADEQAQQAPVVGLLGQGALQGVTSQCPVVQVGQKAVPQRSAQLQISL